MTLERLPESKYLLFYLLAMQSWASYLPLCTLVSLTKLERIICTSWDCYEDQLNIHMNAVYVRYWHTVTSLYITSQLLLCTMLLEMEKTEHSCKFNKAMLHYL